MTTPPVPESSPAVSGVELDVQTLYDGFGRALTTELYEDGLCVAVIDVSDLGLGLDGDKWP